MTDPTQDQAQVQAQAQAQAVLDFWFGQPAATTPRSEWFKKDAAFDAQIAQRFGALIDRALAGEIDSWLQQPHTALARTVVLDQFTRNTFRDTARAFAGDALALAGARHIVAKGWHWQLPPLQRWFVYLPFEHSEDLATQDECLRLFDALIATHPEVADARQWAVKHRDIIVQFGRYPHRNALLGRASTPQELVFLQQAGSSF
jgi:uncharacterized protein (DUF924 family)